MIDLNALAIKLSSGAHDNPQAGMCIMECVAYIECEQHTDKPACACPVVTSFAIRTNDWMNDAERAALLPFVLRIAGSKSTHDIERQRAYMAADYAVRVFAPIGLRARKMEDAAKRLEMCRKIVDKETALEGKDAAAYAYAAAYAAYAYAAADAAYAYAAADAAYAAYAYAYAAAYAAYAADAADAAYKQVRAELVSARMALLDDMLKLTEAIDSTPLVETKLRELVEVTA